MVDVWCFGCGGEMLISQQLFLFAPSSEEWLCETCISHNEEVSSWYEYDDYELAYAGFEE